MKRDEEVEEAATKQANPPPLSRPPPRVTGLFVYPIKSCGGMALTTATLGPFGIEGDRTWMVVNSRGRFQSQRNIPRLALVKPQIIRESKWDSSSRITGVRLFGRGETPALDVPILKKKTLNVSVWDDKIISYDQGDDAASWFDSFLGKKGCRLVYVHEDARRPIGDDEKYAVRKGKDMVAFSDGYPLLLASEESLEMLNARLGDDKAVPMNRFRPNIVVRGCRAHDEDRWKRFVVGKNVEMRGVKKCSRCKMPSTDQLTAKQEGFAGEPLKTLLEYRSGTFKRTEKNIYFGQNVVHVRPEERPWWFDMLHPWTRPQRISLGDAIAIHETGHVPED